MKTFKKILMILCILIIIVGMYMLGAKGLHYKQGYSKNMLIDTAKQYTVFAVMSTSIILIYFVIRYNKQGIIKVLATSILGILGAMILVLAVLAISRMEVSRFFFPIMLTTYVSSIIV